MYAYMLFFGCHMVQHHVLKPHTYRIINVFRCTVPMWLSIALIRTGPGPRVLRFQFSDWALLQVIGRGSLDTVPTLLVKVV